MKMFNKFLVLLVSVSVLTGTFLAYAQTIEKWEITSFRSDIQINPDGKVEITETIKADFANEAHRGAARSIPVEYSTGNTVKYDTEISFERATDENGISWDNEVYEENGYLNIDMYNQTRTPDNGKHTFIVKYLAKNVILFFDEQKAKEQETFSHDEFYWNVNGTEWVVPTKEVKATVHLPKSFTKDQLKIDCFTGIFGETGKNCEWNFSNSKTIEFKATKEFAPFENLTIVVGLPYGTFPQPSKLDQIIEFLISIWPLFLIPIVLIVMILFWYYKGRDDKALRSAVMPHYKPPEGLLPSECGTLIDEKLDPRDITSTIIDLAVKGYLKINEIEEAGLLFKSKDYELELIKPYTALKDYEDLIVGKLFPTNLAGSKKKISELKNSFYKEIPRIQKSIMKQMVSDGYFPVSPNTVRAIYMGIGIGLAFLSGQFGAIIHPLIIPAGIISGLIIIIIGYKMPKKTQKGADTYYTLKGLYEYINTAEKDRMKFQEENNILFEKLLPYAMAFGLIKKWTIAFDGILKTPPIWFMPYHHWHGHPFNMTAFADDLNRVGTDFTQGITSKPGGKGSAWGGGSGFGGGFSGGGFGGGGGHGL